MRLTWIQPEDLLPHALVQAAAESIDVTSMAERWRAAGGPPRPTADGASDDPALKRLRGLARGLLDEIDDAAARAALPEDPDGLALLERGWTASPVAPAAADLERLHGGWLGRAAGCLLGKPVEKIPRDGIRAIAEATGNWPVRGYFTEAGLPADIAGRWPWNRRSRPTSLAENIDGMPEDDDLNFTLVALDLLEGRGDALTTQDVAQYWLDALPAGRVFTAERIAYRNLLDGVPPERAATAGNPFREWIGALIRADAYGWAHPGDPHAAARAVHPDAWLSHRRNGLYGALFAAALAAAAVVADDVDTVLDAGLCVVPAGSALAAAVAHGRQLGRSGLPLDDALDDLHARYGHLHWVHVVNNAALLAYALSASRGEFTTAVGIAVMGGWDTDSVGATAGAVCGALAGADALPAAFTSPLRNRLSTSLPGLDRVAIDALAARTAALSATAIHP